MVGPLDNSFYPAMLILVAIQRQTAAKSALNLSPVKFGVPYIDFKRHINQYILFT